jgi:putative endonuclease
MQTFWVYILLCSDNSYCTGHTDNLELRFANHQLGDVDSCTKTRRPVRMVWSQESATREEALTAELQIKGWGRKKKEAMMKGNWLEVSRLARSRSG